MTSFAETFSLPFKAVYEDAGNPITFSIESLDLIQASLVLATMSDESGIDEVSHREYYFKKTRQIIILQNLKNIKE